MGKRNKSKSLFSSQTRATTIQFDMAKFVRAKANAKNQNERMTTEEREKKKPSKCGQGIKQHTYSQSKWYAQTDLFIHMTERMYHRTDQRMKKPNSFQCFKIARNPIEFINERRKEKKKKIESQCTSQSRTKSNQSWC